MRDMRAYRDICNAAFGEWDEAIVVIGGETPDSGGGSGVRAASVGYSRGAGGGFVLIGSERWDTCPSGRAGGVGVVGPKGGKTGLRGGEKGR